LLQIVLCCCSYIVPEYSFLDARGLGAYEGKNLEAVSEVRSLPVYQMIWTISMF